LIICALWAEHICGPRAKRVSHRQPKYLKHRSFIYY